MTGGACSSVRHSATSWPHIVSSGPEGKPARAADAGQGEQPHATRVPPTHQSPTHQSPAKRWRGWSRRRWRQQTRACRQTWRRPQSKQQHRAWRKRQRWSTAQKEWPQCKDCAATEDLGVGRQGAIERTHWLGMRESSRPYLAQQVVCGTADPSLSVYRWLAAGAGRLPTVTERCSMLRPGLDDPTSPIRWDTFRGGRIFL